MDVFNLSEDIRVACIRADRFPEGVEAAHHRLRVLFPEKSERRFFGISWPDENGNILYRAAAEEMHPGEAEKMILDTFTIRKGTFNSFYIKDFRDDPGNIRKAFDILLGQPEVDPQGYCLEWYIGENDVKCLVPLDEQHSHFTGLSKT